MPVAIPRYPVTDQVAARQRIDKICHEMSWKKWQEINESCAKRWPRWISMEMPWKGMQCIQIHTGQHIICTFKFVPSGHCILCILLVCGDADDHCLHRSWTVRAQPTVVDWFSSLQGECTHKLLRIPMADKKLMGS